MEEIPGLKQSFGAVISQLREKVGASQQMVADHCELERVYISRLERGLSEPSITTIFRLAHYFEIPPGELVNLTEIQIKKFTKTIGH